MAEAGVEKSMDEILQKVQREYAEQSRQEAQVQVRAGAREAAHDTSSRRVSNWEELTPHQIQQARQHVAREREALRNRHAAELKELDAQQDEVDQLERLLAAFSKKHGGSEQSGS